MFSIDPIISISKNTNETAFKLNLIFKINRSEEPLTLGTYSVDTHNLPLKISDLELDIKGNNPGDEVTEIQLSFNIDTLPGSKSRSIDPKNKTKVIKIAKGGADSIDEIDN